MLLISVSRPRLLFFRRFVVELHITWPETTSAAISRQRS